MKQQCVLPICYFPSTVLFVDDSKDFLVNFSLQLHDNLIYKLFDSPYEALEAIHLAEQNKFNERTNTASSIKKLNLPLPTAPEFEAFHAELFNTGRFKEISVVIVDYAMPGLNGIQLCERIKNNQVKKVLLTGKAEESILIKAKHEMLIDHYFFKSEANLHERLTQYIQQLQYNYFLDTSDMIISLLDIKSVNNIYDQQFAIFFQELCQNYNIREYYLLDEYGSFLLVDEDANYHCLAIRDEQVFLADQAELARIDQNISKLSCEQTYYYCFLEDLQKKTSSTSEILSYQKYLNLHDDLCSLGEESQF